MDKRQIDLQHVGYEGREGVIIHAGNRGTTRQVPPAGEEYAYDRTDWARDVQVWVSPTGRSVRVHVDGVEVRRTHAGVQRRLRVVEAIMRDIVEGWPNEDARFDSGMANARAVLATITPDGEDIEDGD